MITPVTEKAAAEFLSALNDDKKYAAVYHAVSDTLYSLSEDGKTTAMIAVRSPSCYIVTNGIGEEAKNEIGFFVTAFGIEEVVSDYPFNDRSKPLHILANESAKEKSESAVAVCHGMQRRSVYELLMMSGFSLPNFDEYYVASFDRAKKDENVFGIFDGAQLVSTASVLGSGVIGGKKVRLIGAVATHPRYRRRGYAEKTVAFAAADCREKGYIPVITYFDDAAGRIYKKIGFSEKSQIFITKIS